MINKKIIYIVTALIIVLVTGFLILSTTNKCGKGGQLITRTFTGEYKRGQTYKVCIFQNKTECGYESYKKKQCFSGECIKWEKCYRNASI